MEYRAIRYETLGAVARVTATRPHVLNAQSRVMILELDGALAAATADDAVRVVIVAGAGTHFSAGHDLGSPEELADQAARALDRIELAGGHAVAEEDARIRLGHHGLGARRTEGDRRVLAGRAAAEVLPTDDDAVAGLIPVGDERRVPAEDARRPVHHVDGVHPSGVDTYQDLADAGGRAVDVCAVQDGRSAELILNDSVHRLDHGLHRRNTLPRVSVAQ